MARLVEWRVEKPSSLLIEHDGLIHFLERPLDYRLRQTVPPQCLIIQPHQHFELCDLLLGRHDREAEGPDV